MMVSFIPGAFIVPPFSPRSLTIYKDYRIQSSTPDYWDENFQGQRSFVLSGIGRGLFALNRSLFDPRWREIRRRLKRGDRLLDAGCGMGQWVLLCKQHGIEAAGLDYCRPLIATLQQRHADVQWIQGEIGAIPLPDCSLDHVLSFGVIEHDEAGPQKALREFFRVLKPGGYLYVDVPYDSPSTRRFSAVLLGDRREEATFYQYFFTEPELNCLLSEAGFTVETIFPESRHYAMVHPHTFVRLNRFRHLGQAFTALISRPYLRFRPDSFSMVFGVGKKSLPGS